MTVPRANEKRQSFDVIGGIGARCQAELPEGHMRKILIISSTIRTTSAEAWPGFAPNCADSTYRRIKVTCGIECWRVAQTNLPGSKASASRVLRLGEFPIHQTMDASERVICEQTHLPLPSRGEIGPERSDE